MLQPADARLAMLVRALTYLLSVLGVRSLTFRFVTSLVSYSSVVVSSIWHVV
jgi:hypothetical protein